MGPTRLCAIGEQEEWQCSTGEWQPQSTTTPLARQIAEGAVLSRDGRSWQALQGQPAPDPFYFSREGVRLRSLSPDGFCGVDQGATLVCGSHLAMPKLQVSRIKSRSRYAQVTSLLNFPGAQSTACGRTEAGTVECWALQGVPLHGAFDIKPAMTDAVKGLAGVIDLAAVGGFEKPQAACAVTRDGAVQCWGANNSRQLGDGTLTARRSPTRVIGIPPASRVVVAMGHACALSATGGVYCWGSDHCGAVGGDLPGLRISPVLRPPVATR
jgi:hypothetical protein